MRTLVLLALATLLSPPASAETYQLVRQWNAVGTAIAVRGTMVYVLNAPAVDLFSTTGSALGSIAAEAQDGPSLAVDGNGYIYVNAGEIRKLDALGTVLDAWAEDADGDGFHDSGVGVDASGNIYAMADGPSGYRTISRLGHDNANPLTFGSFENGLDITVGADGSVYVAGLGGGNDGPGWVHRFNSDGANSGEYRMPGSDVVGVAVGPAGSVFICDRARVEQYVGDKFVTGWDVAARDVAVSDAGEVYVLSNSRVLVYAPTTETTVAPVSFGQLKVMWAR